jgi:hypothetical protein
MTREPNDIDITMLFYYHDNNRVTHPDYGVCLDLIEREWRNPEDVQDLIDCGLITYSEKGYWLYTKLGNAYVKTFKHPEVVLSRRTVVEKVLD